MLFSIVSQVAPLSCENSSFTAVMPGDAVHSMVFTEFALSTSPAIGCETVIIPNVRGFDEESETNGFATS